MKPLPLILLTTLVWCGITFDANALNYFAEDDIPSQILVEDTNVMGTFDLTALFFENVVIDSAVATFLFFDDGDLAYDHQTYIPASSAYYYAVTGKYYDNPTIIGSTMYLYRIENTYHEDIQETVNVALNVQNGSVATTNYFTNNYSNGVHIEGVEYAGEDQDIQYTYYYRYDFIYNSGYDGNAELQINLDQASIEYIMNNHMIGFTLNANLGEDILFNSGELDIIYHVEEILVPELSSLLLLGLGLVGIRKRMKRI
ncbi:hypothetical protein KDK77_05145 [bacterium]|nr:hypothetical protein [bacterium]MCP5463021.1 hypothetical protein [bacterium]